VGDPLGRGDAVHARHSDVHEDDVGAQLAGSGDGVLSVHCLAHHLEVLLDLEDNCEAASHQRLVIGDQDGDHPGSTELDRSTSTIAQRVLSVRVWGG